MPGNVVRLDAFRARVAAPVKPAVPPATLSAKDGKVVLLLGSKDELELSPAHARIWAERLTAMADVAEALEREGHRG